MLVNVPAPEEHLASFAIRQLLINEPSSLTGATKSLFLSGMYKERCWRHFHTSSPEVITLFNKCLARFPKSDLIEKHTLLPLYRAVGSHRLGKNMELMMLQGSGLRHNSTEKAELVSIADQPNCIIKFCPQCFKDQIWSFGFSWFKREWLIHGMVRCRVHECDLLEACCKSCGLKSPIMSVVSALTGKCQKCSTDLWNSTNDNPPEPYANWLAELLQFNIPIINGNLRAYLITNAFRTLLGHHVPPRYFYTNIGKSFEALFQPFHERYFRARGVYNQWAPSKIYNFARRLDFDMYTMDKIPLDCFFFPMFLTFPKCKDFIEHLHQVSVPYTKWNQYGFFYESRILNVSKDKLANIKYDL